MTEVTNSSCQLCSNTFAATEPQDDTQNGQIRGLRRAKLFWNYLYHRNVRESISCGVGQEDEAHVQKFTFSLSFGNDGTNGPVSDQDTIQLCDQCTGELEKLEDLHHLLESAKKRIKCHVRKIDERLSAEIMQNGNAGVLKVCNVPNFQASMGGSVVGKENISKALDFLGNLCTGMAHAPPSSVVELNITATAPDDESGFDHGDACHPSPPTTEPGPRDLKLENVDNISDPQEDSEWDPGNGTTDDDQTESDSGSISDTANVDGAEENTISNEIDLVEDDDIEIEMCVDEEHHKLEVIPEESIDAAENGEGSDEQIIVNAETGVLEVIPCEQEATVDILNELPAAATRDLASHAERRSPKGQGSPSSLLQETRLRPRRTVNKPTTPVTTPPPTPPAEPKVRRSNERITLPGGRRVRVKKVKVPKPPKLCSVCGKTFKADGKLKRHMIFHNGERRFPCEFCDHKCFTKVDLTRHRRRHTGEKPFQCPECPKRFTQQSTMERHTLSHSKEKNFSCDLCLKKFKLQQGVRSHKRKVHDKDVNVTKLKSANTKKVVAN